MAKHRTLFEDWAVQLRLTPDREKQDEILDRWLAYQVSEDVDSDLKHWTFDPEFMMPRARAALEPRVVRRVRFDI